MIQLTEGLPTNKKENMLNCMFHIFIRYVVIQKQAELARLTETSNKVKYILSGMEKLHTLTSRRFMHSSQE